MGSLTKEAHEYEVWEDAAAGGVIQDRDHEEQPRKDHLDGSEEADNPAKGNDSARHRQDDVVRARRLPPLLLHLPVDRGLLPQTSELADTRPVALLVPRRVTGAKDLGDLHGKGGGGPALLVMVGPASPVIILRTLSLLQQDTCKPGAGSSGSSRTLLCCALTDPPL